MNLVTIPLSKVRPAPYNPRVDLRPEDPRYQALVRSIDEFGLVEPLVVNRRTWHLVGGHQRLKVLQARGEMQAEVVLLDLTPQKEKALNVALNKIAGGWDHDRLKDLLDELVRSSDVDVQLTGFERPEIELLLGDLLPDEEDDADLDVVGSPITEPGDLIELGPHRILCGDATEPGNVLRVLVEPAKLCFTDPPYGVAYDRERRPKAPRSRKQSSEQLQNDALSPKRYAEWFARFADTLPAALQPGAPFYIWNGHRNFGLMADLLRDRDFHVASVLTWAKESFSPGFGDYNEQTEFCLYGWKGGARHSWYGGKAQSSLWKISRDPTGLYQHPTQKALRLAERAIRNSSRNGELVYDPFLGGGTTLVAAAQLGRRLCGIEIEPRYCDVAVRRFVAAAGAGAVSVEVRAKYLGQEVKR